MRRDRTRIAEELVAAIRAEVEGAADLPPELVTQRVGADLDRALAAIAERRLPNEAELSSSAAEAASLARARIPIETHLLARRVGIRRSCEMLRKAAAEEGLPPDAQVECVYRIWEWVDTIQVADVEAHRAAELELSGNGQEERSGFVRSLLHGALSPAEVSGRATAYGLLPGAAYRAFRARPAAGADIRALGRMIEATGSDNGRGVLTTEVDGDLCGVVTRRPEVGAGGVVGLGGETELATLNASFELASRALETALAFSCEGVVTIDDLSLRPAILAEDHLGERLVSRYLDPLLELGPFGETLEETVREYLANGMRIEAGAKSLFVHPNTLRHRLERFQQLTGTDLRNTEHVVGIWWALQRRSLDGRGTAKGRG